MVFNRPGQPPELKGCRGVRKGPFRGTIRKTYICVEQRVMRAACCRGLSVAGDGGMVVAANNAGTAYVWRMLRGAAMCTHFEPLHKLRAHQSAPNICVPVSGEKRNRDGVFEVHCAKINLDLRKLTHCLHDSLLFCTVESPHLPTCSCF